MCGFRTVDLLSDPSIPQLRRRDILFEREIGRGGNSVVRGALGCKVALQTPH